MNLSDNMKGAALMSGSMAGFVLNDTFMKLVGNDVGLFQSVFVRGVFTCILIGAFAYWRGAFRIWPGRGDAGLVGMRTIAEVGATICFLTALFNMPLANVTAILQTLPLTIALAAAIFMNEPIGRRRIGAILVGFAGVLIIVRPGADGFNIYAVLALLSVAFVTLRDLSARRFSPQVSSLLVSFITAFVIMVAGAIGLAVQARWVSLEVHQIAYLACAGLCIFVGYYCSVAAMRVGEVPVVSTYRYSVMLWAILLGWMVFGDVPDALALIGMAIIMGAGLFTMWRERSLRMATVARPNAPPAVDLMTDRHSG